VIITVNIDYKENEIGTTHVIMYNTATHLTASLPGQPGRWHQKGKINLDFNKARDVVVAVASVRPYSNHLHLAPHNHASTPTLNFLQTGCSS